MRRENAIVEAKDLTTMVDCINSLTNKGFAESYKITEDGLQSLGTKKIYKSEEVRILDFFRFEGISDPADNSILYAIETSDGRKGTLTDAYGPYADSNVSKFMSQVEEINKKTDKNKTHVE